MRHEPLELARELTEKRPRIEGIVTSDEPD